MKTNEVTKLLKRCDKDSDTFEESLAVYGCVNAILEFGETQLFKQMKENFGEIDEETRKLLKSKKIISDQSKN